MDVKEPLEFPFEGLFSFENILSFAISFGPSFVLRACQTYRLQLRRDK